MSDAERTVSDVGFEGGAAIVVAGRQPPRRIDLRLCRRVLIRHQLVGPGFDTNAELAVRANVSVNTIAQFWSGGRLREVTARRIVTAIDLDFDELAKPIEPGLEAVS